MTLADHAAVHRLFARLRVLGHPLAILPAELMGLEASVSELMTSYGHGVTQREPVSSQFSLAADRLTRTPPDVDLGPATELVEADQDTLMRKAVGSWATQSNGRIESRILRCDQPVPEGMVPSTQLGHLVQYSIAELGSHEVRMSPAAPERVFHHLFSAAHGGAYSRDRGAAYARLEAWQSLAGLVGLGHVGGIQAVEDAVEKCRWLEIGTDHPWFYQVAWDLGLVCLRPDRRTLAILVATDTD
jgi:hypothetical protein